jgi:hypothetical protein
MLKDRQELVQHMEIHKDNPELMIEKIAAYISARESYYGHLWAKSIITLLFILLKVDDKLRNHRKMRRCIADVQHKCPLFSLSLGCY